MTKRKPGPCATCHPPIEPELGRQGTSGMDTNHAGTPVPTGQPPEHVAARWGDGQRAWNAGLQYTVELDGEDVTKRAVEAMAGQPGWVVMEPDPTKARKVADMACRGTVGANRLHQADPRYLPPEHLRTHLRKGHVIIRLTERTPRV